MSADSEPDLISELASALWVEIKRQDRGSIDLSDNDDLTLVAVFDALDLRQLAAAVMASPHFRAHK